MPSTLFGIFSFNCLFEQPYQNNFRLGEQYQYEGNYSNAAESFTSALKLANSPSEKCDVFVKLGLIYWNLGKMEESAKYYNQGARIAEEHNLSKKLFRINEALDIHQNYMLGKKYRNQGKLNESIDAFSNAIETAKIIKSKEHELKCLRQKSITYLDLNMYQQFLELNKSALKIAIEIKHKIEEGRCSNNIGYFHKNMDNYSDALTYFEKALLIAKELNNLNDISGYLNNIGIIYKNLGEFDKALDYLNQSLEINEKIGDKYYIGLALNDIGTTFRNKALVTGEDNNYELAIEYFEECLLLANLINNSKERNELEIDVYNNIGAIYADLNDNVRAIKYFNEGYNIAVKLNDIRSMGMLLNNIGFVHSNLGNYEDSTKYFGMAINLANKIGSGKILWEANLELARAYEKQEKYYKALEKYEDSITQIEYIRSQIDLEELKASFLGTDKRIEAYQGLINLLVKLHKLYPKKTYDQEAFKYLEKGKARAFLDSLEISRINISQHIEFRLQNSEAELMKDISNIYSKLFAASNSRNENEHLYKQLREKENELESLKREIRAKSPTYANLKYPKIINLNEAQKIINSNTAFFEYSIGEEKSLAFFISKNKFKIFELPPRDQLHKMVKEYLLILSDKDKHNFELGYELYNILVSPGISNGIKNIIFVADDILHYLPFETLITKQNSLSWLIEEYEVAYASSISSLREIVERKMSKNIKRQRDLLAFGDPFFGQTESSNNGDDDQANTSNNGYTFFRLKYSGIEVKKISALFSDSKTKRYLREQATETQLKNHRLYDYKIIHFATHCQIDNKKPARSHIALSMNSADSEDGLLFAREIYNLELNSDLVTLSACQTGLGKLIRGEGIDGLNRAFFYAGASSVLMSLWTVNDQATSQLMERFYTYIRGSDSITNSLRKAKLEMIKSDILSHPYYWAGFIVTGKADQIIFSRSHRTWIILGLFLLISFSIIILIFRKNFCV